VQRSKTVKHWFPQFEHPETAVFAGGATSRVVVIEPRVRTENDN